jgi:hypothetical protein
MKVLGAYQFLQMKFDLLPITGAFKDTLGDLPEGFVICVFGKTGNGKTELCLDLATELKKLWAGDLAWLSYEQRHGFDLQKAVRRKGLQITEKRGVKDGPSFKVIDPVAGRRPGVSYLEDLCAYLDKRGSPVFIFIDSIDYTKWDFDDYTYLKERYPTKSFIFLGHAKGNQPLKRVTEQIVYDGGVGILVSKYIAHVEKNRYGGFEPYVIYEERARLLNPAFFEEIEKKKAGAIAPIAIANIGG